jgi:RecG-like helicase
VSESLCSASTINISNSVDLVSLRPNSQFSPLDLSSNFNSSQTNAATTVLGVIAGVITTRSQMKLETDTDSYQDSISNVAFGIESLITNGVGSGEMAATVSNHGSTTSSSTTTNTDAKLQHNQTQSQPQQQPQLRRKDKLDSTEIKDLLACFIYLLSSLSEDLLLGLALRIRLLDSARSLPQNLQIPRQIEYHQIKCNQRLSSAASGPGTHRPRPSRSQHVL